MRVLVIGDDVAARTTLAALLSGQPGLVVEQTGEQMDPVAAAAAFDPDAVVWDLGPAPEASADAPAIQDLDGPVIALSDDGARLAEAVAAGARGALPRESDAASLVAALHAVAQGLMVVDPAFANAVMPAQGELTEDPAEELTRRELAVLQLLAEGLSNKQVARRLGISEHTVKFHVATIFSKVGAHSRTEAVTRAARLGLIVL